MTAPVPVAVSPLRQRFIDEMKLRRFGREIQRNYIRDVGRFATFLRRSPDTATAEELRRFQVEQRDLGVSVPTMNSIVAALRFFFTQAVDRPDLARKLVRTGHVRKLPVVLSPDEVARLLGATTCLKHQAALSVAYLPRQRRRRGVMRESRHFYQARSSAFLLVNSASSRWPRSRAAKSRCKSSPIRVLMPLFFSPETNNI